MSWMNITGPQASVLGNFDDVGRVNVLPESRNSVGVAELADALD